MKWILEKYITSQIYMVTKFVDFSGRKGMWVAIFISVALILGVIVSKTSDKPDSALEQTIEGVLKSQTGIDIDFSKERKDQAAEEKDNQ